MGARWPLIRRWQSALPLRKEKRLDNIMYFKQSKRFLVIPSSTGITSMAVFEATVLLQEF
eukprot:3633857-Amphidinium_carterae.1